MVPDLCSKVVRLVLRGDELHKRHALELWALLRCGVELCHVASMVLGVVELHLLLRDAFSSKRASSPGQRGEHEGHGSVCFCLCNNNNKNMNT